MYKRTEAVLSGFVLATALVAQPAVARVGVDEEASSPAIASAPTGSVGSGSGGYHDDEGGFVLKSSDGDFKLLIGGRLQPRFEAINWDSGLDRDDTATFQVRRARLYFIGHIMGSKNRYFVQTGADSSNAYLTGGAGGSSDLRLYDAWIKHVHSDQFAVKFGQFKTPFGRQSLTSSGKLQLPNRALATELLSFDSRDVGIELSGGFEEGVVQWAAAITNGDGPNTLNLDDSLAFTGRVSVNPNGDYGYSEGDWRNREEVASTIGAGIHYTEDRTGAADIQYLRLNVDGGIKVKGFSLQGEFFSEKAEPDGADDVTTNSFYVQGGYFFRPEKVELAGRISRMFNDGDNNDMTEYTFGLNFFNWGHRLKWQAAYSLFDWELVESDRTDHRFVAQAQLWF